MFGAILTQIFNMGESLRHIQEAIEKAKNRFGRQGLLLPNMINIVNKTYILATALYV